MLAIIDRVEYDLDVIEDTIGTRAQLKHHRTTSWFPPSPFSTQPNTPVSADDGSPEPHFGSIASDGGSDDCDGGLSNQWGRPSSNSGRGDRWVQPPGRICDRSVIDLDDVDQPNAIDHQRYTGAGPGAVFEPSNGHITQNDNELNAIEEGQKKASMQLEKGSEKVKGNQDGQQRDLFVDFLGNKTIVTEGEMEEDISFDAITSHSSDTHIKEACIVNISSGQNDPKEVRGELGQRIIGPHELATKVYVRRKEVSVSRGKAHYPQSWIQFEA